MGNDDKSEQTHSKDNEPNQQSPKVDLVSVDFKHNIPTDDEIIRRVNKRQRITFDVLSQQTFVLMKTPSRLLEDVFRLRLQKTSSRSLQDVLIKTNIIVLVIRFQDVFKTSSRCLAKTSSRHLQDVLKTFWRCLQDVFKTFCKDIFKTFSRHVIKLNTFQNESETYLKRFWDVP